MHRNRTLLLTLLTLAALLPARAGSAQTSEYEVKSAFLLNFAKLVEWPTGAFSSDDAALVVGIMGDEAFTSAASAGLGSKQVGKRPVQLRRISSPAEARDCHLVFVSRASDGSAGAVIAATKGKPTLTVGDDESFARDGGTIAFFSEGGKVRFAVNVGASERSGLRISSRLLGLAKIID